MRYGRRDDLRARTLPLALAFWDIEIVLPCGKRRRNKYRVAQCDDSRDEQDGKAASYGTLPAILALSTQFGGTSITPFNNIAPN